MSSIAEQLKNSPLFKGVEIEALNALIERMKPQSYPAGAILFEKNDPGDTMYIITAGRLRIFTRDPQGHDITLTFYGPPRVFGDFALLDQQPRSASASAVEPLEVLALTRADFLDFLPQYPSLGLAMLRNLTDRVRYITIYLNKINDFGQRLAHGEYARAIQEFTASSTDDSDIKGLIAAFVQMVHVLQEREAERNAPST